MITVGSRVYFFVPTVVDGNTWPMGQFATVLHIRNGEAYLQVDGWGEGYTCRKPIDDLHLLERRFELTPFKDFPTRSVNW